MESWCICHLVFTVTKRNRRQNHFWLFLDLFCSANLLSLLFIFHLPLSCLYHTPPSIVFDSQDMTVRDLLQQRYTLPNGDTAWRPSPLVTAAMEGKLLLLDGIHRVNLGTLAVLSRCFGSFPGCSCCDIFQMLCWYWVFCYLCHLYSVFSFQNAPQQLRFCFNVFLIVSVS